MEEQNTKVRARFRTDLALEARETLSGDPPGVRMREEELSLSLGPAHVTRVEVLDEAGERSLGKPRGIYITLETPYLWQHDGEDLPELGGAIAREIASILPELAEDKPVLVIGLGNRAVTADALGPQVAERVLVTRALAKQQGEKGAKPPFRPVCAFAPGVLGVTGIETFEAVLGLVGQIGPCLVVAVDALAARQTRRILASVQITDTGIAPGSGLGSRNTGLTRTTLGVPVVAVGVPMVVYAATIAWDAVESLKGMLLEAGGGKQLAGLFDALPDGELEALVREVTTRSVGDLVVAPKEIDEALAQVAAAVAAGINLSLHPQFTPEDIIAMQA